VGTYISSNHITLKYALPAVLVSPSTAIYMRLSTSRLTCKSLSIYSLNFPFLRGLIKGLGRGIRRGFGRG
jgi:hypothetical protein